MEPATTNEEDLESKKSEYAARKHRPFYTILTVVTVTSLVFVLSAMSVLVYFRVRHGPMMFIQVQGQSIAIILISFSELFCMAIIYVIDFFKNTICLDLIICKHFL